MSVSEIIAQTNLVEVKDFDIEGTFQYNKESKKIKNIKISKTNLTEKVTKSLIKDLLEESTNDSEDTKTDTYTFVIKGRYSLKCGITQLKTYTINRRDVSGYQQVQLFLSKNLRDCRPNKGGKRKTKRYKRKRARFSKRAK